MKPLTVPKKLCCLFVLTVLWWNNLDAAYIEGIDTTDENGWGMDSLFNVGGSGYIGGDIIADCHFGEGTSRGYFNYSFEDIKIAPNRSVARSFSINSCFITKSRKDSTYAKFKVVGQIVNRRYAYRFGKNTSPNERVFDNADYNRAVMYKPNNLYNLPGSYPNAVASCTTSWDPPLPNDNHLQGYIFYFSKDTLIDTSAPINLTQWDSIGFFTETKFFNPDMVSIRYGHYFNIVAVYTEGRSPFLSGWTRTTYSEVSVKPDVFPIKERNHHGADFSIRIISGRQLLPSSLTDISRLSIYNSTGKLVDVIPGAIVTKNGRLLQISNPPGLYILRAEFPDQSAVTQPFVVAR